MTADRDLFTPEVVFFRTENYNTNGRFLLERKQENKQFDKYKHVIHML